MWIAALIVFLVILSRRGRVGPFEWDPLWRTRPRGLAAATASGPMRVNDQAERILAARLADGELSPDDYYERLSLIQSP